MKFGQLVRRRRCIDFSQPDNLPTPAEVVATERKLAEYELAEVKSSATNSPQVLSAEVGQYSVPGDSVQMKPVTNTAEARCQIDSLKGSEHSSSDLTCFVAQVGATGAK